MGFLDFQSFAPLELSDAFETAELPGEGDVNAGAGGWTTSASTNENDLAAYGVDAYSRTTGRGFGGYGQKVLGHSNMWTGQHLFDASTGEPAGKAFLRPAMGSSVDHPYTAIILGGVALGLWKFLPKDKEKEKDISITNALKYALMVGEVFLIGKVLFGVWNFPIVSPAVEMV